MRVWPRPGPAHRVPTTLRQAGEAGVVGTAGAVVVGVDGTEADGPVVDWASDEAARLGAPLRVVTVIDAGVQMTSYEVLTSGSPSLDELLRAEVHPVLDGAAARARARHPTLDIAVSAPVGNCGRCVGPFVGRGPPGCGRGAGQGAPGARAARLGRPAGRCPCPLPGDRGPGCNGRLRAHADRRRSGRQRSAARHAVEFAFVAAQLCGAAVTAVLVWHLEVEGGVVVTERSSARWAAVEQRYEALGHRVIDPAAARYPGVDVEIRVLHGVPAKVLLEAGADLRAELVVVGSRGRGGFRGLLLGSVSRRVVEQANCAVAVVH